MKLTTERILSITAIALGVLFVNSVFAPTFASHFITAYLPDCDAVIFVITNQYSSQDCDDNTIIATSTSFASTFSQTVSALSDYSLIYIKSGTYTVDSTLNVNKPIHIKGAGTMLTKLVYSGSGTVLNINPNVNPPHQIMVRDLTIDFTSTTGVGIEISNVNNGLFENIHVIDGSVAMKINSMKNSRVQNFFFENFATYGLQINGDGGAENRYIDGMIIKSSGSATAGVHFTRSQETDVGGSYFTNVLIGSPSTGAMTYCWNFESTTTNPAYSFIWMTTSVGDSCNTASARFKNIGGVFITNSWLATGEANTYGLILDHVDHLKVVGGSIQGQLGAVRISNSGNQYHQYSNVWLEPISTSGYGFAFDATAYVNEIDVNNVELVRGTLSNDMSKIMKNAISLSVQPKISNVMYIKQSGRNLVDGTSHTITLPVAEPDTNYYIIYGWAGAQGDNCRITSKSTTSFSVGCDSALSSRYIEWMLIRKLP